MPTAHNESQTKINQLRSLLQKHNVDAIMLRRVSSFAWATCGVASYVNTATTEGAASLLVTRERLFLITNNIEAPRLEHEENLVDQGWEFHISPWHTPLAGLQTLTTNLSLVSDVPFPGSKDISKEISILRAHLTPEEDDRFRVLGHACAEAITAAAQKIRPGMSELQMAGLLGLEAQQRGIQPIVNLIATDDRAYHYRHPLPTVKLLDKYAMLVLSGRCKGLVCSISRLMHFGPVPGDLQNRIIAAAQVNATFIAHTQPGCRLSDVLAQGQQVYANAGFPGEWQHHHQGGATGYEPREYLATPASTETVSSGQAFAWNPTIAGAKMEDTILVGEQSNEIITSTPLWPTISHEIPGQAGAVVCSQALEL